tara:strand:+ start:375 stop:782 length:408 start_codon:yes stop_codon:yes gene_type:complete
MNHINLNDDYRKQLLENAVWNKVDITMSDESGVTALEEEAVTETPEETQEDQEVVEEGDIETNHVCPVCSSDLNEAVDTGIFLEHLEKVASLAEAIEYINENYEAEEDDVILGALAHVFPEQFKDVEFVTDSDEE